MGSAIQKVRAYLFRRRSKKTFARLYRLVHDDMEVWESVLRRINCEEQDNEFANKVVNSIIFVRLSFGDLLLHWINCIQAEDEWEKRSHAKYFALALYEFYDDLPRVYGRDYRTFIGSFPNAGDLLKSLNSLLALVNERAAESSDVLKNIRNNVAGHRDHNAIVQLDELRKIDMDWLGTHYTWISAIMLRIFTFEVQTRTKLVSARLEANEEEMNNVLQRLQAFGKLAG